MKKTLMAGAFCALLTGTSLFAAPMPLDGTWIKLDEVAKAPFFFSGGPWTWNVAYDVKLTVTDWAAVTDQFSIYDNGLFVFSTSNLPDDPGGVWMGDPDAALASGLFSNGSWIFDGGVAHSIMIEDTHIPIMAIGAGPYADGTVAFKAEAVPDVASTLMLLGVGLLVLVRRRRS